MIFSTKRGMHLHGTAIRNVSYDKPRQAGVSNLLGGVARSRFSAWEQHAKRASRLGTSRMFSIVGEGWRLSSLSALAEGSIKNPA